MQNDQNNSLQESSRPATSRKLQSGNLILVGMMGSGKTTMGRTLAKHLGKVFVDSDEEIIKRTGVTVPHIFDIEGEAGFRLVLEEQNRAMLQQNGIVIYLKASVHDLWQRTRHDRNRPLLQTGNPHAKLTELFQQRDPLYRQVSDIVVQSGKQSAHALMLHLADEIDAFRKSCR